MPNMNEEQFYDHKIVLPICDFFLVLANPNHSWILPRSSCERWLSIQKKNYFQGQAVWISWRGKAFSTMKFLEKPFELLEGKSLDGFLILGPYASGFVVVSMWFLVNHRPYLDHT